MKTVGETRLDNLELLIKKFKTLDEVATLAGSTSVYLSQVRNRTPDLKTGRPRQMGDRVARRLEEGAGLDPGWMDVPHASESHSEIGQSARTGKSEGAAAPQVTSLSSLRHVASPRSIQVIGQLMLLASGDSLSDEDWEMIERLASRLAPQG